jgi:uncharacterized small protein (DUF1192 family)
VAAHIFELLFNPPQTKPHPAPARSHIALSFYSVEKDRILLWGECLTVAEIQGAAKALKADLDRIVAEARRKFPKWQGGSAR